MNDIVVRTPLISYQNSQIFLKPENLQPFGSYKIRGVSSAVQTASPDVLKHGLFAASAGNMAQSVAYIAWQRSIQCRIFVPDTAPDIKKNAIKNLGAELIELPFAQVWEMVRTPPKNFEGLFIHPGVNTG